MIFWAPINAFMEQILWIYLFEAFANQEYSGAKKNFLRIVGLVMSLIFVGMIHALFWDKFLMQFGQTSPYYEIFFISQFIIVLGYIFLYEKTKSMLPLFFIHIITDITAVIGSNYSIIPYLFNF
ncbi:MAG: CPBP family glutamic-type intramembrane protease [Promethearchaeia archaeon]